MKRRVLDFLCCPDCWQEKLDVSVFAGRENGKQDIAEGEVRCRGCGSRFPVINGISRMLPSSLRQNLGRFHQDFFTRHPDRLP